jgi:hypothetical protein
MDEFRHSNIKKEKIERLQQAIFYCYDENNNKLPVGLINSFVIDESYNIWFNITRFPLTHKLYETCDAELSFHKKGESYHLNISGFATITDAATMLIKFDITNIECLGEIGWNEDDGLQAKFLSFFKSIISPYTYARNFRLESNSN